MVIFSFCNVTRQGSPFKSAVAPKPRRCLQLLSIMAALILVGCATDSRNAVTRREILQPWTEITGAQAGTLPQGLPAQMNSPHGADYIALRRPAAMSARGNDIYLLDAGLRRIFRYDNFQQTLTPFATTLSVEAGMSIYAAPDMSVYVTDPAHERVLHFNWDGTPLPPLVSRGNLARPVSVVVDELNGQVLVADSLFDRIIAFDSLGMTLSVFKPQQVLSIAAMATGPDGIYVVDRLAKQIVVLGWDGTFRYAFGADALSEPGAIAVGRDNLVFISDNFDYTIRVYRGQRTKGKNFVLADKIGGVGVAPGSFNGIGGLATADDLLYVADSLNARVQIMLINPRALDAGK
jgi:DNA-binding beta-propeller fold protein YncE